MRLSLDHVRNSERAHAGENVRGTINNGRILDGRDKVRKLRDVSQAKYVEISRDAQEKPQSRKARNAPTARATTQLVDADHNSHDQTAVHATTCPVSSPTRLKTLFTR